MKASPVNMVGNAVYATLVPVNVELGNIELALSIWEQR